MGRDGVAGVVAVVGAGLLLMSHATVGVTTQRQEGTPVPTYTTFGSLNGHDYPLRSDQAVVVFIDESASYLESTADTSVVHVFVQSPTGAWLELGQPTTAKSLGPLAKQPAKTAVYLGMTEYMGE